MWIAETIDLDDHDSVVRFMKKQSDKIEELSDENEQLKQSNKNAWNLIKFIYDEIKEDGSMDWGRIQDLVEF